MALWRGIKFTLFGHHSVLGASAAIFGVFFFLSRAGSLHSISIVDLLLIVPMIAVACVHWVSWSLYVNN